MRVEVIINYSLKWKRKGTDHGGSGGNRELRLGSRSSQPYKPSQPLSGMSLRRLPLLLLFFILPYLFTKATIFFLFPSFLFIYFFPFFLFIYLFTYENGERREPRLQLMTEDSVLIPPIRSYG